MLRKDYVKKQSLKRKRGPLGGSASGGRSKRTRVGPGYTRTAGYYGRYSAGGELKFFDGAQALTAAAPAGAIFSPSLNLIPQGVTESSRVGRKCTAKSLHMTITVVLPNIVTDEKASDCYRIIVYKDKQTNGATAAVLDILEAAQYNSYRNLANSGRFVTLYDKTKTIVSPANDTGDCTQTEVTWSINLRCNMPLEFSGVTGAIGEIRSNNLGVLVVNRTTAVKVGYTWRLRFSDN